MLRWHFFSQAKISHSHSHSEKFGSPPLGEAVGINRSKARASLDPMACKEEPADGYIVIDDDSEEEGTDSREARADDEDDDEEEDVQQQQQQQADYDADPGSMDADDDDEEDVEQPQQLQQPQRQQHMALAVRPGAAADDPADRAIAAARDGALRLLGIADPAVMDADPADRACTRLHIEKRRLGTIFHVLWAWMHFAAEVDDLVGVPTPEADDRAPKIGPDAPPVVAWQRLFALQAYESVGHANLMRVMNQIGGMVCPLMKDLRNERMDLIADTVVEPLSPAVHASYVRWKESFADDADRGDDVDLGHASGDDEEYAAAYGKECPARAQAQRPQARDADRAATARMVVRDRGSDRAAAAYARWVAALDARLAVHPRDVQSRVMRPFEELAASPQQPAGSEASARIAALFAEHPECPGTASLRDILRTPENVPPLLQPHLEHAPVVHALLWPAPPPPPPPLLLLPAPPDKAAKQQRLR